MAPPELRVLATAAAVAAAGAEVVRAAAQEAVQRQGRFTLALSGGSTPRTLYTLLAQPPYNVAIPWTETQLFWSDERCVPPDHTDSNYRMAREALLDHVPIPAGNVHRMRGELLVPQQAAQEYRAELQRVFGKQALPRFDLLLLGMGEEGHTASIFPGVTIPSDPNVPVAAVFVPKVNTWRLTLTLPVLNAAAHVLFLVAGAAKQDALRSVIQGPRSLDLPAQRVIPSNGTLTFLADRDAAAALPALQP
ncbi:MAG TPA: 6-phosphogluconolactonase [Chloroflexota bacterium]